MSSKWSLSGALALSLAIAALLASPALAHFPIPPKKGETGRRAVQTPVPDFSLVDQEGNPFRFESARGKIVLLTFVYTACPDVCPLLAAKFASIQRTLNRHDRDDTLLLTITTDPDRDTPAALKSYANLFKADFRHWLFLTGSQGKLAQVWESFGVAVKRLGNGQIQHTALTTLIDRRGSRRVDYYGDQWQEKEILKDIFSLESSSRL